MYYTMFSPNMIYRKPVKDVQWNEQNWRWETTGLGMMRKLEQETPMLKWLLKSLLILAVFVPFATALPFAALWLCRTPDGAQFLFWTGPVELLLLGADLLGACAQPVASGAEAVRQWREAERRAAAHGILGHRLDVLGVVLRSFARRVPDGLYCPSARRTAALLPPRPTVQLRSAGSGGTSRG